MKFPFIFISLLLFISNCFPQALKFTSTSLTNNAAMAEKIDWSDTTSYRVKTLIPLNKNFKMDIISGLQWSVYGTGVGLVTAVIMDLNKKCDKGLCYLLAPVGTIVGFLSGFIYSELSSSKTIINAARMSIGLQLSYEATMSELQNRFGESYGIVYRRPNKKYYIPDNYYFHFGLEDWSTEANRQNTVSSFNPYKYGIELSKTNYSRILHFTYGMDFGYTTGTFSKDNRETYDTIIRQEINTIYSGLLIGVGVNLFKFLHFKLLYKYELFGAYYLMNNSGFTNSIQHSAAFSARCFLF